MNTNERELILNECKSREFISVYSRAFATVAGWLVAMVSWSAML